jgi:hypothetical protein
MKIFSPNYSTRVLLPSESAPQELSNECHYFGSIPDSYFVLRCLHNNFLLNKSLVFDQIKSGFFATGMVFGRHFVTFSLLRGIYAQKRCFWWVNLYVLPSVSMRFFLNKMVSLCDTHWGNFNKFAKFVKMVRVQRVKTEIVSRHKTITIFQWWEISLKTFSTWIDALLFLPEIYLQLVNLISLTHKYWQYEYKRSYTNITKWYFNNFYSENSFEQDTGSFNVELTVTVNGSSK